MARTDSRGKPRSNKLPLGLIGVSAVLGAYVIAGCADEQSRQEDALLALSKSHTIAYAEGERNATSEWAQKVAAAYGQGQRDALASLRGRPEAMQVAQLCRAWRSASDAE